MIISQLHRSKQYIAGGLLAALSVVFVTAFLCDAGLVDIKLYAHHTHENETCDRDHFWNAGLTEEGEHEHGLANDDDQAKHEHNERHNDECCEEETNQLFANLIKTELSKIQVDKSSLLITEVILPRLFIIPVNKLDPYRLKSSLSPPSGSQIRVFLQSFLC